MLLRGRVNEKALEKIRALFSCEGIDFNDVDAALKSLSETCLPTKLTRTYLNEIENESIRTSQATRLQKPKANL